MNFTPIKFSAVLLVFMLLVVGKVSAQNAISASPVPVSCQPGDSRKALLLLGSYHMANPGLDQFNLKADDITTSKRQDEILTVVKNLAEFKPTKVAIERPFGDSTAIRKYKSFVNGNFELEKSESQQIGFRLAEIMGHSSIFPIDYPMKLNTEAMGQLATEYPEMQEYLAGLQQVGQEALQLMGKWLSEGTISYMLYNMNRPEMLAKAHRVYLAHFLPVVKGDNYAGAAVVAQWYERNIRIFSNLHKISNSASDRIVVIYGQGHIPILKQLAEDSPYFCLEDPLPYLQY